MNPSTDALTESLIYIWWYLSWYSL